MWIGIVTMTKNYPEIWDEFITPANVDRKTTIDTICLDLAELDLLYDDPRKAADLSGLWYSDSGSGRRRKCPAGWRQRHWLCVPAPAGRTGKNGKTGN